MRKSYKQRLIEKLESTPAHREEYAHVLWALKGRGSGPLPSWMISLGRDLGVD